MNYSGLKKKDIANGPGVRVSLFVSGCRHHCKNCFNAETWSFSHGKAVDESIINEIFTELDSPYVAGLSLLGGEPMEPENQDGIYEICKRVKEKYPTKDIWLWTGCIINDDFTLENNYNTSSTKKIFELVDYIVDGPFVEELKNISLKFRGSTNQRIIDMKASLANKKIINFEEGAY